MLLTIAFIIICVLLLWDIKYLPTDEYLEEENKSKFREYIISDIRGANQYCLALIAFFGVMTVVIANKSKEFMPFIKEDLWPFEVAFIAAAVSVLFIPGGYDKSDTKLKIVWLKTIFGEQVAVVFTFYGGLLNLYLKLTNM